MKRALASAALLAVSLAVTFSGRGLETAREILRDHGTPQFRVPTGWPAPRYTFADNRVTAAGFALGRKLFYDASLSRDGTVACGSCHQQFAAFAHLDHRVSHGVGGVNGVRNAPALFNLAWQPEFMWDGASNHLETQPILPISNPVEMGVSIEQVVARLQEDPSYAPRFAAAFGDRRIDSQRALRALAQFTGTMISDDARYDRVMAGHEKFTADEQAGLGVFRDRCASCHAEPLFTDFSYRNNGLDALPRDRGRALISRRPEDVGRFRVPTLRNIALTAPYMHDGRFDTLEQVLDHYQHGIAAAPTLDPILARGLELSSAQRQALLAFLQTLTDEHFVEDRRFAETDE